MDVEEMKIINMIQGYSQSYVVYSAVELGIFNALYKKSMTSHQLATKLQLSHSLLERFMKVLVAMEFVKQVDAQYSSTSLGDKLSQDSEESMAAMILFNGRICMKAWGYFYDALKRNSSPIELMEGEAFFEVNAMSHDRLSTFNQMMRQASMQLNLNLLCETRNIDEIKKIIDIGGGAGDVMVQLLEGFPYAEGIILDKDYIREEAEQTIHTHRLKERCRFVEGDFFLPIEHQSDVYVLSRILHDWDDHKVSLILRNIADVMTDENVLFIIEKLLPEKVTKQTLPAFLGDMHIWALCNGKERTEKEYEELLHQEHLYIAKKHLLNSDIVVLEVKKNVQNTNRRYDYEVCGAL
ncbi:methyltransferase [Lysinibacillus sp. NPDC093190]|uniref:methyltransferase n=1 Tax=Lysinibacillus sp. NPDC093190 TaxID=3390575 RepID=UPI003D074903